jgi:hypothetical protein
LKWAWPSGQSRAAFDFAAEVLAGELLVLPDIGAGDAGYPAGAEQLSETASIDAAVVGNHRQGGRTLGVQRVDQGEGHAAQAEPAHGEGGVVGDVGHRVGSGRHDLVQHGAAPLFTASRRSGEESMSMDETTFIGA